MNLPLSFLIVPLLQVSVCGNCQYHTIGEAIAQSPAGSTITVSAGTYKESNLTIDKPLNLRGEGFPVIDGDAKADVLRVVKTQGVEISGFQIRNSGRSFVTEFAGIKIEDSEKCRVANNRLSENNYGIYLANTNDIEVQGNIMTGVPGSEADTGNGIHLWQAHDNKILNNTISGQRDGIYFEFVSDSVIEGNHSCRNLRYGLHFMFSHRDKYVDNEFCENGAGVAVMYSQDIEMLANRFDKNAGPAAYGLLLKDIGGAQIRHNEFVGNSIGVYMEGTNRGKFENNLFKQNGWGLRIFGDCDANRFSQNNFVANTFDVTTNSDNNPNTFEGNYWSQYDGYDLANDGEGDRPFRLVSLSSVVMERVDSSYALLRSPLLLLLDQIERALPTLIPAKMEDKSPRMQPADAGWSADVVKPESAA